MFTLRVKTQANLLSINLKYSSKKHQKLIYLSISVENLTFVVSSWYRSDRHIRIYRSQNKVSFYTGTTQLSKERELCELTTGHPRLNQ